MVVSNVEKKGNPKLSRKGLSAAAFGVLKRARVLAHTHSATFHFVQQQANERMRDPVLYKESLAS